MSNGAAIEIGRAGIQHENALMKRRDVLKTEAVTVVELADERGRPPIKTDLGVGAPFADGRCRTLSGHRFTGVM